MVKKALTIAGFDPSGGAGIQADLKVFHALGVYGLSAVAALTAQNSAGVAGVQPVEGRFLKKQLQILLADLTPDATKVGMVLTAGNVGIVAGVIRDYALKNVVLDPVMISSSGKRLSARTVPGLLKEEMLPFCTVITPNIHEASVLSDIKITSKKDMEKAAVLLRALGPDTVIVTGGHLSGNAVDVVFDGSFHYLKARKQRGEFHGTGCIFSSALAAFLAKGFPVPAAANMAKEFMTRAFFKTYGTGRGMRLFVI